MRNIVLISIAAIAMISPASAQVKKNPTTSQCQKNGYITQVYNNFAQFPYPNVIGIEVREDDGTLRHYTSYQSGDVAEHPETRALLQMATAAMLAQTKVAMQMDKDYCGKSTTFGIFGTVWYLGWSGLTMINE